MKPRQTRFCFIQIDPWLNIVRMCSLYFTLIVIRKTLVKLEVF